jgi:hypothetical protein
LPTFRASDSRIPATAASAQFGGASRVLDAESRKWVAFSVWRFGVPAILTAVGKKSAQKLHLLAEKAKTK